MSEPVEEANTRKRMLDAALGLFAQNGFSGTSMRMLARATGLRESSFYNHFASKEALYQAVISQWGPMAFVERLKSAEYRALAEDPRAFFKLCGRHLVERWMDPRERQFMALINREGPEHPGKMRYHDALFREEIDLLAAYCAHFATACGLFAPDPRETARMFAAGLTFIRREHLTTTSAAPDRKAVQTAVDRYIDNFLLTVLR